MSVHSDGTRTAAGPAEEDTRDGSLPPGATSTWPGTTALSAEVLAQIRTDGLLLPRQPFPGQGWAPSTGAEQHLLREGYRLNRVRLLLLAEVSRLRRCYADRAARRSAVLGEHTDPCPLKGAELRALVGAAAGESPRGTGRRVLLTDSAVRKHRLAAQRRLGARSLPHAVALAVAAGWITSEQITEGLAP